MNFTILTTWGKQNLCITKVLENIIEVKHFLSLHLQLKVIGSMICISKKCLSSPRIMVARPHLFMIQLISKLAVAVPIILCAWPFSVLKKIQLSSFLTSNIYQSTCFHVIYSRQIAAPKASELQHYPSDFD